MTSRAHVRTVVTQYDVAELFGAQQARARRSLIAIAHPDFRDASAREARQRFYL